MLIVILNIFDKKNGVLGINSVITSGSEETMPTPVEGLQFFYQLLENRTVVLDDEYAMSLGYVPGAKISYSLNKDGLNQEKNIDIAKNPNIYRIVAIGDSFTFGLGVNTRESYPSQIEKYINEVCLNEFEVLNLGVGGYDIRYAVERFKVKGKKYDPDLVLWLFIDDNFLRTNEALRPNLFKLIEEDKSNKNHRSMWKTARDMAINDVGGEESLLKTQEKNLQLLNNYYSNKLALLTFSGSNSRYNNILQEFTRSRENIYHYNGLPNNISRLVDGHPDAAGYADIAKSISKFLIANKIISCN